MLSLPPSVRLFVATQPIDGRKGVDSLMVLVRDFFRYDVFSGPRRLDAGPVHDYRAAR